MDIFEEKKELTKKIEVLVNEFTEKFPDNTLEFYVNNIYGPGYGKQKAVFLGCEVKISII